MKVLEVHLCRVLKFNLRLNLLICFLLLICTQHKKGMTEDELVGWHHRLSGHEFKQALGGGEGHGTLACCSPWGPKELDTTEQLNSNKAR